MLADPQLRRNNRKTTKSNVPDRPPAEKNLKKRKNQEKSTFLTDPYREKGLSERCILAVASTQQKNQFGKRNLRATVEFWVEQTYGQSRAGQ